jgi:hypothetical protein
MGLEVNFPWCIKLAKETRLFNGAVWKQQYCWQHRKCSLRHSTCTCCDVTRRSNLTVWLLWALFHCSVKFQNPNSITLNSTGPIVSLSTNRQSSVDQCLLIAKVPRSHSDTPQSTGLLWTSDHPYTGISTWQHTTLTTVRHPCRRRDSNTVIPAIERP